MNRRQFLTAGAVGMTGTLLTGCTDIKETLNQVSRGTEDNNETDGNTQCCEDLEDRLEGAEPAESYEVLIVHSATDTELWYQAEDVIAINVFDTDFESKYDTELLVVFTQDYAEQMQETVVEFGDSPSDVTIFQYLGMS